MLKKLPSLVIEKQLDQLGWEGFEHNSISNDSKSTYQLSLDVVGTESGTVDANFSQDDRLKQIISQWSKLTEAVRAEIFELIERDNHENQ